MQFGNNVPTLTPSCTALWNPGCTIKAEQLPFLRPQDWIYTHCAQREEKKQTCRTLCSSHSPVLQVQAPRTAKSLKARQLPTPMLFLCLHIRALDCATEASSLFSADSTQCHLTYLSLRQSDIQEPRGETAKQFCHPQRGQGSLHIGWGCQQGQQCRG